MWICKLLGHKFLKIKGEYIYRADHCWRCGKYQGGA